MQLGVPNWIVVVKIEFEIWIWSLISVRFKIQRQIRVDDRDFDLILIDFNEKIDLGMEKFK